jgi:hypothetical protein
LRSVSFQLADPRRVAPSRAAHGRRPVHEGDHALPEALRRPARTSRTFAPAAIYTRGPTLQRASSRANDRMTMRTPILAIRQDRPANLARSGRKARVCGRGPAPLADCQKRRVKKTPAFITQSGASPSVGRSAAASARMAAGHVKGWATPAHNSRCPPQTAAPSPASGSVASARYRAGHPQWSWPPRRART